MVSCYVATGSSEVEEKPEVGSLATGDIIGGLRIIGDLGSYRGPAWGFITTL